MTPIKTSQHRRVGSPIPGQAPVSPPSPGARRRQLLSTPAEVTSLLQTTAAAELNPMKCPEMAPHRHV